MDVGNLNKWKYNFIISEPCTLNSSDFNHSTWLHTVPTLGWEWDCRPNFKCHVGLMWKIWCGPHVTWSHGPDVGMSHGPDVMSLMCQAHVTHPCQAHIRPMWHPSMSGPHQTHIRPTSDLTWVPCETQVTDWSLGGSPKSQTNVGTVCSQWLTLCANYIYV